MTNWSALQKKIGITFRDSELLQEALRHSSFVHENIDLSLPDNERLEFIGDAVLGFVVAEKLYQEHNQLTEGELTELRSFIIRKSTLAQAALKFDLGAFLSLGKGEESADGRKKESILADSFEALIGALYLDQGLDIARNFIYSQLADNFQELKTSKAKQNYKSLLQEYIQRQYKQLPVYILVNSIGPDHDKTFTIEVRFDNNILGVGIGKTKQIAETEAACSACDKLNLL